MNHLVDRITNVKYILLNKPPDNYKPEEVSVPFFIPDTAAARQDIADQYRTISRLDQGT